MKAHKINEKEKDNTKRIVNYNLNKYFDLVDTFVWKCKICGKEFDENKGILHLEKYYRKRKLESVGC